MPQKIHLRIGDVLHPKKGGVEHEVIIHLIAEVIIIFLFYWITRPKKIIQQVPYPSLTQQVYQNNQITQAIEQLRGW